LLNQVKRRLIWQKYIKQRHKGHNIAQLLQYDYLEADYFRIFFMNKATIINTPNTHFLIPHTV